MNIDEKTIQAIWDISTDTGEYPEYAEAVRAIFDALASPVEKEESASIREALLKVYGTLSLDHDELDDDAIGEAWDIAHDALYPGESTTKPSHNSVQPSPSRMSDAEEIAGLKATIAPLEADAEAYRHVDGVRLAPPEPSGQGDANIDYLTTKAFLRSGLDNQEFDTACVYLDRLRTRLAEAEEEIHDGDYWQERATEALENGTCPVCFAADEEGHTDDCEWGQAEKRAEAAEAQVARLREGLAEVRSIADEEDGSTTGKIKEAIARALLAETKEPN